MLQHSVPPTPVTPTLLAQLVPLYHGGQDWAQKVHQQVALPALAAAPAGGSGRDFLV